MPDPVHACDVDHRFPAGLAAGQCGGKRPSARAVLASAGVLGNPDPGLEDAAVTPSTAAPTRQKRLAGEAKRSHSTGPTLILTPSCYGYVAFGQMDGELVVTERAKSRRAVPLSPTAEKVFRHVRTRQWAERLMAGSMWQPTHVWATRCARILAQCVRGVPPRCRINPWCSKLVLMRACICGLHALLGHRLP